MSPSEADVRAALQGFDVVVIPYGRQTPRLVEQALSQKRGRGRVPRCRPHRYAMVAPANRPSDRRSHLLHQGPRPLRWREVRCPFSVRAGLPRQPPEGIWGTVIPRRDCRRASSQERLTNQSPRQRTLPQHNGPVRHDGSRADLCPASPVGRDPFLRVPPVVPRALRVLPLPPAQPMLGVELIKVAHVHEATEGSRSPG